MPKLTFRTRIPVSADSLYAWHLRPGAFERLVPPWQDVRVVRRDGPIGEGVRVLLRMRKGLMSFAWEALHDRFAPGREFRDTQVRGPFARWVHTHRMIPDGADACVLEDAIEYRLPLGGLGALLAGRSIRRDLVSAFAFRHRRTLEDLRRHAAAGLHAPLRVLISGATGLVGGNLAAFLATGGHRVDRLVRRTPAGDGRNEFGGVDIPWDPAAGRLDAAAIDGVDAIVHLSGENIAGGRWTAAFKTAIRASRVESTKLLARTIAALKSPPRVFIGASAVGLYGDRGEALIDEHAPPGRGFLPQVCEEWEAAASPLAAAGVRVAHLRLGVVIARRGGALPKLLTPFRLGAGGVVGSGRQFLSWVALDDVVYMLHHLLHRGDLSGPFNGVGPAAVDNRTLTRTLGRVLRRPTLVPLPSFAVRLMFGEMGQACLLEGVRALPRRLQESGYAFVHETLDAAIRAELGRAAPPPPGVCEVRCEP